MTVSIKPSASDTEFVLYDSPHVAKTAKVLVVDDDRLLADLVTEWVEEKWACRTVYDGAEALSVIDDGFDVVLLDRQMPGTAGEEVLTSIRERNLPVQVMMVSGIEPDYDIIDLPIDDYLRKPVDRPTLQTRVEGLLLQRWYDPTIQQFFICLAKIESLESAIPEDELAEDERYLSLRAKADELRQRSDATLGTRTEHVDDIERIPGDD